MMSTDMHQTESMPENSSKILNEESSSERQCTFSIIEKATISKIVSINEGYTSKKQGLEILSAARSNSSLVIGVTLL